MIILEISNQRSYFYVRISDISNIGFVWQELSNKGYFKLHHFYNFSDHMYDDILARIQARENYYDSLDSFLKR